MSETDPVVEVKIEHRANTSGTSLKYLHKECCQLRDWVGSDQPDIHAPDPAKLMRVVSKNRNLPALMLSERLAIKIQDGVRQYQKFEHFKNGFAATQLGIVEELARSTSAALKDISTLLAETEATSNDPAEVARRRNTLLEDQRKAQKDAEMIEVDRRNLLMNLRSAEEDYLNQWRLVHEDIARLWTDAGLADDGSTSTVMSPDNTAQLVTNGTPQLVTNDTPQPVANDAPQQQNIRERVRSVLIHCWDLS
ncbi:hypothetical protein K458DRAFT_407877 [Lentithecium fluviatile CBS 122367]|uniref:Uncharacterized protein n=1 Tax=Lentithecium fluviatile CBS 122367 TaxID=1168545 RepID=A0A6G1INE9_9PLEO|nr:hypothetical protein K458DRAFT_407877 [Lentithecium fluviatile CBS 122367]